MFKIIVIIYDDGISNDVVKYALTVKYDHHHPLGKMEMKLRYNFQIEKIQFF